MNILNLKEEAYHIGQLSEWHHNEWSYLNPDGSVEKRADKMKMYLGSELVPSTFIGKDGEELIGSAAIVESDMDTHEELSPWLASVYVSSNNRKKGYGASLVMHVMEKAKEQGIEKLYLFTPSEETFYKNIGWCKKYEENYRGHLVTVMEVTL
jgi:N-acetylglutamate synthase-like GNAT family acetyltransferase